MADNKTIVINVEGNTKKIDKSLDKTTTKTAKLKESLKSATLTAGIGFASLAAFVGKSVQAYRKQELAVNELNQSLKTQGIFSEELSKRYQDQASALQKLTLFGDEEILAAQTRLQAFLGEKEITQDLTQAVLDFAQAKKVDLATAAELVGKTIGSSTNALSRYGVALETGLSKTEKMTALTKSLEDAYGGTALASTKGTGALIQLGNQLGDIVEKVGKRFVPVLEKAAGIVKDFATRIEEDDALLDFAGNVVMVGVALTGLVTAAGAAVIILPKLTSAIALLKLAFVALTGPIGLTVGALAGMGILINSVIEQGNRHASTTGKQEKRMRTLTTSIIKQKKSYEDLRASLIRTKGSVDNLSESEKKFLDRSQSKITAMEAERSALQKNIDKKNEDVKATEKGGTKTVDATKAKNKELLELEREFQAASDEFDAETSEKMLEADVEESRRIQEKMKKDAAIKIKAQAEELKKTGQHKKAIELLNMNEEKLHKARVDAAIALEAQKGAAIVSIIGASSALATELLGKESKAAFVIQKAAALASIAINTAMGIASAASKVATLPLVPYIAGLGGLQAALVTATAIKGFAQGGMVEGGIPGRDSVPIMAQRGEIIAPTQNFDEVIESVARSRGFTQDSSEEGGSTNIVLTLKDQLVDFIEAEITERRALGEATI